MRRQDKKTQANRPPTQHGHGRHKTPPIDPRSIPDPLDSIRIQVSTEIVPPKRRVG